MYKMLTSILKIQFISLLLILLFLSSCGGGSGTNGLGSLEVVNPTPSGEFLQFVSKSQFQTPEEFIISWNNQKNNWKFSYYGENNLTWPDYSSPEEIYNSRIINCYRISKLLQYIYNGELVFVNQEGLSNYDHCYLLLPNGNIINNNGVTLSLLIKENI